MPRVLPTLEATQARTDQGSSNVTDALNALSTAEGANSSQADALQQLNVISIQASNDFLSSSDRSNLQTEANQIVAQINTTSSQTNFNGQPLEQGQSFTVQAGATEGNTVTAQTGNTSSQSLGVSNIDPLLDVERRDSDPARARARSSRFLQAQRAPSALQEFRWASRSITTTSTRTILRRRPRRSLTRTSVKLRPARARRNFRVRSRSRSSNRRTTCRAS